MPKTRVGISLRSGSTSHKLSILGALSNEVRGYNAFLSRYWKNFFSVDTLHIAMCDVSTVY